jgi:DNA-binding CsgD family transcriptional regulator/tetratricopeptide (TPR) repeat protein
VVGVPDATVRRPLLVGRVAELAALRHILAGIRRGGQIVVVEGEAGIGKTSMIEAAIGVARDEGMDVLTSRAEEFEAHRPFAAIGGLLLDADWPDNADGTGDLRPDLSGEREFRVAERVLETLDVRCAAGPVMLAVEDLQWADQSSIAVLARIATEIHRLPVAFVVSGRSEPRRAELERLFGVLSGSEPTWIRLGPLDEGSTIELAERLLGAPPGPRMAGQMRRAGGNPLFVYELVDALAAAGAIDRRRGTAELAADAAEPSLPLMILHRLSFLPRDVLDLLDLASVLGAAFSVTHLSLLARRPVAEVVPALRTAQRAGVLGERGERLAFRHELVRDALYEDMLLPVRRGLHGELAQALADAGEPIERRVEHLVRASAPGDEKAIAALIGAARELTGRAPETAVDVYRRAIALSTVPDARRTELLPELAEALVMAGSLAEGEASCREALGGNPGPEWSARLRVRLMFLLLRQARPAEAALEGEAGLADPRIAGLHRHRLEALVAMARVFSGDVEPAVSAARAVIDASDDDLACALATNTLAWAAGGRGAYADAAELIAQKVRWAERSGTAAAHDARPHLILDVMLVCVDRLDEAYETIQRGRRVAERCGIVDQLAIYHLQAAYVDLLRGRLDDALAELATHAQLAEQTEIGWRVPAESVRALIAIHRDDLLAAEQLVRAAERDVADGAPPHGTDLMALARARLLEAAGDVTAALDTTARTFDRLVTAGSAMFLSLLGAEVVRLAVRAGHPSRAGAVAVELRRIAELNPGARSLQAGALHARGLLDSDPDALRAAVDLLRYSGRLPETARAAEDAAASAVGGGAELLEEARSIYERCRATRDVARVEAALRALGVRRGVSGPRRRPPSGWEALTETELTVVRLVAERLTNPEIAERMFISRRTVQTHVSHALAKVGVATRRELAAEAARRGGWRLRVERLGEHAEQPQPAVESALGPAVDHDDT